MFSSPIRTLAAAALALCPCLFTPTPARALDRGDFSLEVLVDGVPLTEYAARGTVYVEARPGREYALRLSNRTGRRIAVALAVDGLNTIDAKTTTAAGASKWVLGPWQSVVIDGWQTGANTARRFFFTSETGSYGAWLGKTKNLGVLSAVVYRERRPPVVQRYVPPMPQPRPPCCDDDAARDSAAPAESNAAGGARRAETPSAQAPAARDKAERRQTSDELAATGIGREVGHAVTEVELELESTPAASFDLRYEYHDALVRLGVLPRPETESALARRERARGFSGWCPVPGR